MILGKIEVLKLIKEGKIKIEPFEEKSVGPASIDLTLDNKIRVFVLKDKKISINDGLDYLSITKEVDITKGYLLKPNELVIGMTKEKITLPDNLCAWLNSRSKFARVGFMSHISAPFMQPGISNRQALEIFNAGNEVIELLPGVKVCQLIIEEVKGGVKYTGRYKDQ